MQPEQPDLPIDFEISEIPREQALGLLDQMIAISALFTTRRGDIADVMAAWNHYCRLIRPHLDRPASLAALTSRAAAAEARERRLREALEIVLAHCGEAEGDDPRARSSIFEDRDMMAQIIVACRDAAKAALAEPGP